MSGSFTQKRLSATIKLAVGSFGDTGANTVTYPDPAGAGAFRISLVVDKYGALSQNTARVRLYGLPVSVMNQLTHLSFNPLEFPNNTISVSAAEGAAPLSLVYAGNILAARADYSGAPEVFLDVQCMTGYYGKLAAVPPTSYQGATDVSGAMAQLAAQLGFGFEDNGVKSTLFSPYLPGSAWQQAVKLSKSAGIDMYLDDDVLAICPRGVARAQVGDVPVVAAGSGLVGYPTFDKMGISFRCLYDPSIVLGGLVQLRSVVTVVNGENQPSPANGQWRVVSLGHVLESEKPEGEWFSTVWVSTNQAGPFQ